MNDPVGKAKAIFDEAAEIASKEERAAYLDRACAGDQDCGARSKPCFGPLVRRAVFSKGRRISPATSRS